MIPGRIKFCLCACMVVMTGCTLGPRQIHQNRLQYNDAIQRTFQEEMLLNLVRLKYRDTPEFLTVGGIAAQYTFEGSAGSALTLPKGGNNVLGLNGRVARSERPTISYAPARGEEFQKGLLAPIDLQTLQLLARTGWRWDRILRTTVQYMNEIDNAISAGGPTPERKPDFEEFQYLSKALRELQVQELAELVSAERVGIRRSIPFSKDQLGGDFAINAIKDGFKIEETDTGIELTKSEKYVALVVRPEAKQTQEFMEVARILGIKINHESFEPDVFAVEPAKEGRIRKRYKMATKRFEKLNSNGVEQASFQQTLKAPDDGSDTIVISTRSLLEVMFYLSQGISVPSEHYSQGLVTHTVDESGNQFDWNELTGELLCICSSRKRPENAAVAVQYKGYWFYIDECDLNSQSTFTLLIELFGIEVRAGGGGGFLYTLNVGG